MQCFVIHFFTAARHVAPYVCGRLPILLSECKITAIYQPLQKSSNRFDIDNIAVSNVLVTFNFFVRT